MFGEKVKRTVLLLNARPGYSQRASKYAAMLPLAGMDPSEYNRQAARTLTLVPVNTHDNGSACECTAHDVLPHPASARLCLSNPVSAIVSGINTLGCDALQSGHSHTFLYSKPSRLQCPQ